MGIRTDLISEQAEKELFDKSSSEQIGDVKLLRVEVQSEGLSKKLSRPKGKYYTVEFQNLNLITDTSDIKRALEISLDELLPEKRDSVLVVGLGNSDITPDALGPLTVNSVIATRHIGGELKRILGVEDIKSVSAIAPNVLGKTGVEASQTVKAVCDIINPDAVILIDALAARSPERLCRTIQLTDSGISPGSGVNNSRGEISEGKTGVKVVAIGIPTVIDASTYRFDLKGDSADEGLLVTPKDIDLLIEKSAKILSQALNRFLQPFLDDEMLEALG